MTEYDWRTGLDFDPDDAGPTSRLDPTSLVVENLRLQAEVAASQRAVELGEASLRRLTARLLEAERQALRASGVDAALASLRLRLEELQAEVADAEARAEAADRTREAADAAEAERRAADADRAALRRAPPAGPRTRARNVYRRLRRLAAGP